MSEIVLPDRATVAAALGGRLSVSRVRRDMKLLEPYFLRAERRRYDLHDRRRLKRTDVRHVLRESLRLRVDGVEYLPAVRPVSREEWMTGEAYDSLNEFVYVRTVVESCEFDLPEILHRQHMPRIIHEGGTALKDAQAILEAGFGQTAWQAVEASLFAHAGYVIECVLQYWLAMELIRDMVRSEWLMRLVRLLHRCVPLGHKRGWPGIRIVLVGPVRG